MLSAAIDQLPGVCIGALIVLFACTVRRLVAERNPDREWSKRYRAQRAELRRIRRGTP